MTYPRPLLIYLVIWNLILQKGCYFRTSAQSRATFLGTDSWCNLDNTRSYPICLGLEETFAIHATVTRVFGIGHWPTHFSVDTETLAIFSSVSVELLRIQTQLTRRVWYSVDRFAGTLVMRSATCSGILSYQLVQRLGRLVFIFQYLYSPYNINAWPSMRVGRIKKIIN